jgi:hypothetical protein
VKFWIASSLSLLAMTARNGNVMTQNLGSDDRIAIASSRFWAAFHFNLTRWIFPARMAADAIGVSTNIIEYWLIPWRRIDEHLPLSHIAEVTHIRGFFWDAISVESSGGLNPLRVFGVPKSQARAFVDHVRERLNQTPVAPR